MNPVRLVLLDEQRLFRELLATTLDKARDLSVVGEAGGSCRAVAVCRETRPDVAIMDLRLPHINETELATCLRKHLPALRIVALTDLTDAYTIRRAVDAGLQGYVEKGQPLTVLLQAVRHVAAGETYFTEIYQQRVRETAEEPFSFPKVLSAREQQILALVAEGRTSRAVAQQLGLSSRTVESHRRNIMKKMDLKDMAGLVRFAVLQGFRFEECRLHDNGQCAGCAGS
ncbi:MAG TPA: response regulator transcription factor [Kiritimatiellia bacterium]|nr:response regulator transcription factor [Kiritimatiellia bacterium]HRZ13373.1 response regulator transcription factor [Kiritimatiellia bacterium]HSA18987.1 response regulator transcription factor [Kiritimatiellia bacterium]